MSYLCAEQPPARVTVRFCAVSSLPIIVLIPTFSTHTPVFSVSRLSVFPEPYAPRACSSRRTGPPRPETVDIRSKALLR
jgi:hypothetical protein